MIQVVVADYKIVKDFSFIKSLRDFGFEVTKVDDFTELVGLLFNKHVDVVIIDHEFSGLGEVLSTRQISFIKNFQALGLIVVTCACDNAYRLELVSHGADAFLSKPVDVAELRAHINNIYSRTNSRKPTTSLALWHFHRNEWRLVAPSGISLGLSHLEVNLMDLLAKSPGKPVKRKDIVASGFGLDPLSYDNRRLDSIVSRLRRKIRIVYPLSQPIKVVHSVGYVFIEPIKTH